jgi:subtilisin family serine protease
MREYNVILKEGIDYDEFWDDIESDTDGGKLYIPNRRVEFTNERPTSLRQCWYLLTDEEAEQLKLDDRVYDVEIPPEHRTDIQIGLRAVQSGDFTKTTSDSGAFLNWGMIRCNSLENLYGTNTTTTASYNYTLTGDGVDVVIQDSGIQTNHPEFNDEFGNNRVQQINWFTTSGVTGTQNANHYRDYDGHGTHVASTAAGLTYGWAKKARIYSQKLDGLEGIGDSGTGISISLAFDCIKGWHNNKPNDPKTGVKRPTVVNMSWGYSTGIGTVTSVTYRGSTISSPNDTALANTYGLIGVNSFNRRAPVRISSVDTDIQELLAAGVIVCIAAGNGSHKIDTNQNQSFSVGNNGSSNYTFSGAAAGSNPTLNLVQGATYTFNISAVGHPFYIKTVNSTGTGNAYNTGVTNNGTANGTLTFTVPFGAPSTLYYNCQFHSSMAGTINISGTNDYNNSFNNGTTNFYHRGSSPFDDDAIMVGNVDSTVYSEGQDQKATSSETGPGVTIYAPGTNIMGACSTTNAFVDEPYYLNSTFRQMNISGTSMASPQVAGVCALLLEVNPKLTPAQVKSALLGNAGTALYDTGTDNDWTNNRSLKGGAVKFLYNKFNTPITFAASNITMIGVGFKVR